MGNTCTYIQAQANDGCWSLAQRCGITQDQLTQYNTEVNFCNNILLNQYVCCSAGSPPDFSPKPSANGTCYTYAIATNDICSTIAAANYITVDQIESYNSQTWGWIGCGDLQIGQEICLSSGSPPFPAPVQGNVCGPQVSCGWFCVSLFLQVDFPDSSCPTNRFPGLRSLRQDLRGTGDG